MKALISALSLLAFVGAVTLPAVAHAQTTMSAPAKKKTKKAVHHKATKAKKTKKTKMAKKAKKTKKAGAAQ
jgi:hypothetical protein